MDAVQSELFARPPTIVGTRLRVARWLAGYTQSELAHISLRTPTLVSDVELGKRTAAPATFADCLPVDAAYLCKAEPSLRLASAHGGQFSARASYLIGIVIADLQAYLGPFLDLASTRQRIPADTRSPERWANKVRETVGADNQQPIAHVIDLAEQLGIFVASTGSQAGPAFVAGLVEGAPMAAIPAGPDCAARRWSTARAIGALATTAGGGGSRTALRLAAELLIPADGIRGSHRSDWSGPQNAAQWGAPVKVYEAVAGLHRLRSCGSSVDLANPTAQWEQSERIAAALGRLRSNGVQLPDIARQLGYPPSVLRSVVRGLTLTVV